MDRGMKVMFGMMTAAIFLMAANMFVSNSPQAYAMSAGDRGPEPTIVSFRVTPLVGGQVGGDYGTPSMVCLWRMWSNGMVEVNYVGKETLPNWGEGEPEYNYRRRFEWFDSLQDGWIVVQDTVGGFACAGDTDENGDVDVTDLLTVIADWGECEEAFNIPEDEDM